MLFPDYRPRRLRQNEAFRRMVRETQLDVNDLILPLFAVSGKAVKKPIASLPGQFQLSKDHLVKAARQAHEQNIPAIILFGIPESKDPLGTHAYTADGVVPEAIKAIKDAVPDLSVITDVCLCAYTDHGHCGVVDGQHIDNDATLDLATIEEVGIGGNYLTQPKTFELCRTAFFLPELMTVQDYDGWQGKGGKRTDERASDLLNKRLANYEKPDIDSAIESELSEYVTRRKTA